MTSEISEDTIRYTMEMIVAMMICDLSRNEGISINEALDAFMRSRTADALFDKETGMWLNGPTYLYDNYMQERMAVYGYDK